jgi:hypothetical protein
VSRQALIVKGSANVGESRVQASGFQKAFSDRFLDQAGEVSPIGLILSST